MSDPIVSCLCVSKPSRWGQLQRAVLDFDRQDYPLCELIVVVEDHSRSHYANLVGGYVSQLKRDGRNPIKVFPRPIRSQLEGLTYAMCQARGDLVTVWDDDNLNAPG